jgi:hypothetical protein
LTRRKVRCSSRPIPPVILSVTRPQRTFLPLILQFFAKLFNPSAGGKEDDANNWLEKKLKKGSVADSTKAAIQLGLSCLQNVLALELKKSEVEVGLVTIEKPEFRRLTEDEIDAHLNEIAEHD